MKSYHVTASAHIHAPAAQVYAILADYHNGHPLILPTPPFLGLQVEEGGVGAGTRISFQMRISGKTQSFYAAVTEPEPGRVLVETNLGDGGAVTTFNVDPFEGGQQANVTITTEGRTERAGVLGAIEERLSKLFLRRVYIRELALLDVLAQQRYAAIGAGG
jgi:hypothetical protein